MATDTLSTTFAAPADPTRRAILARLARGPATVKELSAPFAMSGPAVSKHLKVLHRAGLIARGREPRMLLQIADGTIYDPIDGMDGMDGIDGDLWIRDGKVIAAPADLPDKVVDAAGLVVMPGGIDMHSHIAGPKVNLGLSGNQRPSLIR